MKLRDILIDLIKLGWPYKRLRGHLVGVAICVAFYAFGYHLFAFIVLAFASIVDNFLIDLFRGVAAEARQALEESSELVLKMRAALRRER